ncbi:MAG TPA: GGDEF domain-containing protein [Acidobacteriaceae bacterium]|nr:GGDEF domain-containing protein [Acidobacteriaceae bacterium]
MREPDGPTKFGKQQILAFEAISAASGIGAFLVLKHFWLRQLSSGGCEAAVAAFVLLWTAPAYFLLYRKATPLPTRAASPAAGDADLQIFRTVIDSLPDRIYVKDTQSKFILTNRALREFATGSPDTDIVGKDDFSFFPDPVAARFHKDEQAILDSGIPVSHSGWDKDAAGNQVWTLTTKVPFRDKEGRITGLIGIGRDLTAQKRLEESLVHAHKEMRHKATHDALTSLLNRGMILDLLERELHRARREFRSSALLLVDVDHFKLVNDGLGHLVGDEVLREVARRLTEAVRSYDFVGRYGGEEFLLVLSNCDNGNPLERAEEIRKSICSTPIVSSRGTMHVTVSIGVLTSSDWSSMSTEEMLRQADTALYIAKAAGRNCCHHISSQPGSKTPTPELHQSKACDELRRTGLLPNEQIILAM